jgi:hypothetical protein
MKALDFLTFLEETTRDTGKTYLMLRMTGPNTCTDVEKLKEVYAAYKFNLDSDVYQKIFHNEFVYIEFNTDDEAVNYAFDNFPKNTDGDADYYIFACVISEGTVCYSNDELAHYYTVPLGTKPED